MTHGLDLSTDTHRAAEAVEQVLATLAQLRPASSDAASPTLLREQQMLGRIARQFHLPEEQLRNRMTALRRARQSRPTEHATRRGRDPGRRRKRSAPLTAWDRDLLALVLLEPAYLTRIEAAANRPKFTSPAAQRIYGKCVELAHAGQPIDFDRLLLEFDDAETKSVLVSLDEFCQDDAASAGRPRAVAAGFALRRRPPAGRTTAPPIARSGENESRRCRIAVGPLLRRIAVQATEPVREEKEVN